MSTQKIEQKVSGKIGKANEVLNLLERIKTWTWQDVIGGISKTLVLVFAVSFCLFLINPKPAIQYYMEVQQKLQSKQHMELIDKRVQNTPYINTYLDALRV